jgi:hypothetical protein
LSDLVLGHRSDGSSEIIRIFIDGATEALGRRIVALVGANGHEIVGTAAGTAAVDQPREQALLVTGLVLGYSRRFSTALPCNSARTASLCRTPSS